MPGPLEQPRQKPFDWRHAPIHRLGDPGAYIVTSATYRKQKCFSSADRLSFLSSTIIALAQKYEWRLQAWAVFPNHYHFVGESAKPDTLRQWIRHLHSVSAKYINTLDGAPGRVVWFEYWDTNLREQKAHVAALHYVHFNAVKHGIVKQASGYRWCSAGWSGSLTESAFTQPMKEAGTKNVGVPDDCEVGPVEEL